MEFSRALDALMVEVRSGSLDGVRTFTESLEPRRVRPVLESAVLIGFKEGASLAILSWMAERIGTLRVSRTHYGATRLVRCT
jgi:hypothetical protein